MVECPIFEAVGRPNSERGIDLPVACGVNNFDVIRYEYYRDREVGFEGFTAKNYLFREEFTSRTWATRYDFPAFKDGRVKRTIIPDATPSGAQGWFINTRREKFKDRRLREALIDAFDFELLPRLNAVLLSDFGGQYDLSLCGYGRFHTM